MCKLPPVAGKPHAVGPKKSCDVEPYLRKLTEMGRKKKREKKMSCMKREEL